MEKESFKKEIIDDNITIIKSLFVSAADYSKTSLELVKLKALDKSSNVTSTFISHYVVLCFTASFLLFLSIGASLWLGEILGKIWLGYFGIATFYGIAAIIIHFFLHKKLKRSVSNYIIKEVLK